MRTPYRLTRPPAPLRRARLDNLVLVPGDLLPYQDEWQAIANRLPRRAVLIVLPKDNPAQRQIMLSVAKTLSEAGHQVRVIPAAEVR
jgi:hypothetical protein